MSDLVIGIVSVSIFTLICVLVFIQWFAKAAIEITIESGFMPNNSEEFIVIKLENKSFKCTVVRAIKVCMDNGKSIFLNELNLPFTLKAFSSEYVKVSRKSLFYVMNQINLNDKDKVSVNNLEFQVEADNANIICIVNKVF